MKKLLFTLLVLLSSPHILTYAQNENSNKTIEQSISCSWVYSMNLLDFNVPNCNEFAISYALDYNLPNTSLFLEIGASLGYSHHVVDDVVKVHAPYVGVPLGIGFHIKTGNLRVSPFFRLTPFVTKYLGKDGNYDINSTDFGGVAPELGATLNFRKISLTASIPMLWDTNWWDYSRCGQTGLRIGIGFPF